jgi:OPA family glycerol-3-phosphate transporter-like MFS transporter
MLFVMMFCYMFFYTGRHNFGWAAKAMASELHVSYTMIGWVSFSMLIGYALGQLINGNLADHFSPRIMIPLGGILSVGCNILISFAHTYPLILCLWAINGYAQSMAWAPGSRLISNWWGKEEKGKAFGFYTMAAGISSVITFLLSVILLQQGWNWRWLFRIPVALLFIGVIIFYFIARNKPSDKGYENLSSDTDALEHTHWKDRYKVVFYNRTFLIACLAIGFESMARYGFIFWVPIHYLGKDWKANPQYLWVTVLMPIGMAIGGVTFGQLSDTLFRGNRILSIRLGMVICSVIAILIYLLPVSSLLPGGILMFLAGFFVYGPQANFWPLSPDLLGEKYVGTGIGIMNMCAYVFAALGEPILGSVIDKTKQTGSVFIVITVLCILSAVVVSFVKMPQHKMITDSPV